MQNMTQTDFHVMNGQVSFLGDHKETQFKTEIPKNTISNQETAIFNENQYFSPQQDYQQGQNVEGLTSNEKKKIKSKRNSQNSIRTTLRSLKKMKIGNKNLKDILNLSDTKYFEAHDPRVLLAIFRNLFSFNEAKNVQHQLSIYFESTLRREDFKQASENKQKRQQKFLQFFLNLQEEDFSPSNLQKVLEKLSSAGQLKKHPADKSKYKVEQFEELSSKIFI